MSINVGDRRRFTCSGFHDGPHTIIGFSYVDNKVWYQQDGHPFSEWWYIEGSLVSDSHCDYEDITEPWEPEATDRITVTMTRAQWVLVCAAMTGALPFHSADVVAIIKWALQ